MKNKNNDGAPFSIILILILILIIGLVYSISYYVTPKYDESCLKPYALKYCQENNMTFQRSGWISFNCASELNQRTMSNPSELFYFLDSELESCKVKQRHTFKKIK